MILHTAQSFDDPSYPKMIKKICLIQILSLNIVIDTVYYYFTFQFLGHCNYYDLPGCTVFFLITREIYYYIMQYVAIHWAVINQ